MEAFFAGLIGFLIGRGVPREEANAVVEGLRTYLGFEPPLGLTGFALKDMEKGKDYKTSVVVRGKTYSAHALETINKYEPLSILGKTGDYLQVARRIYTTIKRFVISKGGKCAPGRGQDWTDHETTSETYVLAKSHTISTPTILNGLTINKYMLGVSLKSAVGNMANLRVRVVINDTTEWDELQFTDVWLSKSKEITAGTYKIDIYIRTTDLIKPVILDENFVVAGVGTDTADFAKIAYISAGGELRSSAEYMIAEGKPDVTVSCKLAVDMSASDAVTDTFTETDGYYKADTLSFTAFATVEVAFYLKTTVPGRPAFLRACETRGEEMLT